MPYGVQKGQADRADRRADRRQEAADPRRRQATRATSRCGWCSSRGRGRSIRELLLESLYRLTDLEIRFPLNLNVLDASRTPGVMSLKQALTAWLAFQIEVLLSRAQDADRQDRRAAGAARRLPDRLPQSRPGDRDHPHEDEPKPVLMAEFALTDRQAEAILNMRLRHCAGSRKWRSRKEREALAKEREELAKLVEKPGAAAHAG